ncbi:hypothetical protein [Baia soyae]|uniref:Toxin ETX/toxin MTX2 n=1 Tax=Baia soyae TaxID=1544746 RepID=A0A4R2S001_9BACL|nr:hypothetical protein [Baia soyae]TCP69213.1 hypothetical protein EDD57_1119 [Baia soyae]
MKLKKIVGGFLAFATVCSISLAQAPMASAQNDSPKTKVIDFASERNYDPINKVYVGAVYKPNKDGVLEKVDFKEYMEDVKKSKEQQKNLPQSGSSAPSASNKSVEEGTPPYSEFEKTGEYTFSKGLQKVSNTIDCRNVVSCSIAQNWSISQSYTVNIGLSREMFQKVTASVGFSWQYSASASSIYTFNLASGTRGYIAFNPRFGQVLGWAKTWKTIDGDPVGEPTTHWVDARYPKKVNGQLDGYVTFVHE